MQADANCGHRAVASLLDFGEAGWTQVRRDLFGELNCYPHLCEGIYENCQRVEKIRNSLSHFDGIAPYDKWMIMPEMRFSVSSHYNVESTPRGG